MNERTIQSFCRAVGVIDAIVLIPMAAAASAGSGVVSFCAFYLMQGNGFLMAQGILLGILLSCCYLLICLSVVYGIFALWFRVKRSIYGIYTVILGITAFLTFIMEIIFCADGDSGWKLPALIAGIMFLELLNSVAFGVQTYPIDQESELQVRSTASNKKKMQRQGQQSEIRTEASDSLQETKIFEKESVPEETWIGIGAVRGYYEGAVIPMKMDDRIIIGTNPEVCQIVFHDSRISRIHCMVSYIKETEMYEITDFSKNGTYLNDGERLARGIGHMCPSGTMFYLNHKSEVFQVI